VNNKSQDKIRNQKVRVKGSKGDTDVILEDGAELISEDSEGDMPI